MGWLSLIPMPSLALARLIGAALAAAACFGAGWTANGWRSDAEIESIKRAQAESISQGVRDALEITVSVQKRKDEALHAAMERGRALDAARAAADVERDGLRNELSAARADLSRNSSSPGTDNADAAGALLDILGEGIERLSSEGARIAAKADGHASDAKTLTDSWPTK